MPMNVGYECKNCHCKRSYASLSKLGEAIMLNLNCGNKECGTMESVDVTSFGFDIFEPKASLSKISTQRNHNVKKKSE